jgi:hypothetical protein
MVGVAGQNSPEPAPLVCIGSISPHAVFRVHETNRIDNIQVALTTISYIMLSLFGDIVLTRDVGALRREKQRTNDRWILILIV